MNRVDLERWKPAFVLAALTLATVASTAVLLSPDEGPPPVTTAPARAPELPSLATYAPPPKGQFNAINERPLFMATRRPFVPEAPPPPPAPPPAPAMATPPPPAPPPASLRQTHTLIGIVEASGERTALLRANAGAVVVRLAEGDSFQGWTMKQVGPDTVRVRAGEMEELIEFPKTVQAPPMRAPGPLGPPPAMGPIGPARTQVPR